MAKAKKTTKKKAAKKAVKKTRKAARKPARKTARTATPGTAAGMQTWGMEAPPLNLERKLQAIAARYPEMDTVSLTQREHKTTRAYDVFRRYQQELVAAGISMKKIAANLKFSADGKTVGVECRYMVRDTATGEELYVESVGTAAINMGWGGNSAQTLALKQALLELFQTSWNNDMETAVERASNAVEIRGGEPVNVVEAIGAFFCGPETPNEQQ